MAELLTFAVQETLKRVISLAAQEFSLLWGLKSEIKKLRESLKMVEALLRDADRAELHGEAVKLWVKKLAEVAQLADDVLDDYGYEVLRRKVQIRNGMARKVQDFFSHSNTIVFRHKMAHQIKKINACLDELRKDASVVGLFARQLDPVTTSHDGVSTDRETYSILTHDERNIIGRDDVIGLDKLTFLLELNILYCSQLTCLPSLDKLTFLRELNIHGCSQLTCLPSLDKLTFLRKLSIGDCSQLTCLPSLDKLTSLDRLSITKCSRLTSLPSGLTSLAHLNYLEIGPFWEELDSFPAIQVLPQLKTLTILGWPKLKSLPEQIQYLTSLKELYINCFEGVEAIPDWLGNLTSLEDLDISNCKNLMYLPSLQAMQRITKLNSISIEGCPLLSERCTEVSGAEWPKISHIQYLNII